MSAMAKPFNWLEPDYAPVIAERIQRLVKLRENPAMWAPLKTYYAEHPAALIADWADCFDPRLPARGLPATVPMVLFPKQVELIQFVYRCWREQTGAIVEKSRDTGASDCMMKLAVALCVLHTGISCGIGSKKEALVDNADDPSSLFWKARAFLRSLPPELRAGFDERRHTSHMKLIFPETGSSIVGSAGDQLGRGGRSSLFIVDESAFLERPQLADAALSANSQSIIHVSSANGLDNSFANKRFSGAWPVFTYRWQSDPRKTSQWYAATAERLGPAITASELDIDYAASVRGTVIPSAWIACAVDAHVTLGVEPDGWQAGGLDVADEGPDLNALCMRRGILLTHLESWSGAGSDLHATTQRAFAIADAVKCDNISFDADGLGAGVRASARILNEQREARIDSIGQPVSSIDVAAFHGSGSTVDPDKITFGERPNREIFGNLKAQSWFYLRKKFETTYNAIKNKLPYDRDEIISIDSRLPLLAQLMTELSRPTWEINSVGRIYVCKTPDGSRSPNLADSAMICYSPLKNEMLIWRRLAAD